MKYGFFKTTVSSLLRGDNQLKSRGDDSEQEVLAYLNMAFQDTLNLAESLHLATKDKDKSIFRVSAGGYLIRRPILPKSDEDDLDIDESLCIPCARFIASYVCKKENVGLHRGIAKELISSFNRIVEQTQLSINKDEDSEEYYVSG